MIYKLYMSGLLRSARNDDTCRRHCERSEAIQIHVTVIASGAKQSRYKLFDLDCFMPRNDDTCHRHCEAVH